MSHTYKCARGAALQVLYGVISGDPAQITNVDLAMRRKQGSVLTGPVIDLTSVTRPKAGQIPAGFNCVISSALSTSLEVGLYQVDAFLTIGGVVEETQPFFVQIHQASASPL